MRTPQRFFAATILVITAFLAGCVSGPSPVASSKDSAKSTAKSGSGASSAQVSGSIPPLPGSLALFPMAMKIDTSGRYLAAGLNYKDGGNRLLVFDLRSGLPVADLQGHSSSIFTLDFDPRGKWLASGSKDCSLKVWDWKQGKLAYSLDRKATVNSVLIDPHGWFLLSGGMDNKVTLGYLLFGVAKDSSVFPFAAEKGPIISMAIDPTGHLLATGLNDDSGDAIRVWLYGESMSLATLSRHKATVSALAFSTKGDMLFSGDTKGELDAWDMRYGSFLRSFPNQTDSSVWWLAALPDGERLVAAYGDGTVKVFNIADGSLVKSLGDHGKSVEAIAVDPKGRYFATGARDGRIVIWSARDYSPIASIYVYASPKASFLETASGLVATDLAKPSLPGSLKDDRAGVQAYLLEKLGPME